MKSLSVCVPVIAAVCYPMKLLAVDGASISLGEADLYPSITLNYFNEDNVYLKHNVETESSGTEIRPEAKLLASMGLNEVVLGYRGDYASYSDVDNLDYTDHLLYLDSKLEFSSRSKLLLDASFEAGHSVPSEGLSLSRNTTEDDVLQYNNLEAKALYHYGSATASGGLEFGLNYANLDYTNFASVTAGHSFSQWSPSFTFLYRLSSDTRLTTGLEYKNYSYDDAAGFISLDHSSLFVFVGSQWEVTGKTKGFFKLGHRSKDFSESSRNDSDIMGVDAGLEWEPTSYSRFDLSASRDFIQDTQTPSIRSTIDINWKNNWSSRVYSLIGAEYSDIDSDDNTYDRVSTEANAGLFVSVARWIDVGASVTSTNRTSHNAELEYSNQRIDFSIKASL